MNLVITTRRISTIGAEVFSLRTTRQGIATWASRPLGQADSADLLHGLRISVWVRWFVLAAWFAQLNYRPNFADPNYVTNTVFALFAMTLNGYVHYRLLSNKSTTWHWPLALSAMDAAALTAGLANSGGFSNSFFTLYYPSLAIFAVVFTSFKLSFIWVTMVAALYAAVSLAVEPGVDFELKEEKVLFTRIVVMYAVVAAVNLVSRIERIRRWEAVERERELHRERTELSQAVHDSAAQSAYMIGMGLETAIELADESNEELIDKLKATHALSRSSMWGMRRIIDAGPIFEGRELSRVLRSHAATFATITSIPAELIRSGREPDLPTIYKSLLFSIAHNAMTNAFRHADASKVTIRLNFEDDGLQMSISDDGVGLLEGYTSRGHGFRNMRADAERMSGRLEVAQGETGRGTTVTCAIPYEVHRAGE